MSSSSAAEIAKSAPATEVAVTEAIRQLEERRCPVDGSLVTYQVEYDEDGDEHRFDGCAQGHTWPYRYEAREWWPDEEKIAERLEECGAAREG